jgi:hypothetical protein
MGFDASSVEGLEIRGMSQYGIPDQTIPDPTNKQIRAFGRFMSRTFEGSKTGDIAKKYAKAIEEAGDDEEAQDEAIAAIDAELYEVTSRLCSGKITGAQLEGLPKRVFGKLFEWLLTELRDPTVSSPATKPSLTVLKGEQSAS